MLYDDFDEEDIDDATYGDSGGEDYGDSSDDFDDSDYDSELNEVDYDLRQEQREQRALGERYCRTLTSPKSTLKDIWNAIVCYRDLLRYYMKPEIPAPKLTVILSAIRRVVKRDYNASFGWTFRILVTECLPLCEASKTQLRDLQTLFRDTFETITTFYLALQLARSSLNTQRLLPTSVAREERENIPSSEKSEASRLLLNHKSTEDSKSSVTCASVDRAIRYDRTNATTRTVKCGRYNLRIPIGWFPSESDDDYNSGELPAASWSRSSK